MRGLIGFETDLVNMTKGMGVMSHLFHEYGPDRGEIAARKNGSLVSMEDGEAMAYALNMVQERGRLMVEPGDKIYMGMIVGENARENDIPVNPVQGKAPDQHAFAGRRQGHPARAAPEALAGTRAGIHRTWTNTWKPRRRICACAKKSWTRTSANAPPNPAPSRSWLECLKSLIALRLRIADQPERKFSRQPVAVVQFHSRQRTLSQEMHHHTFRGQAGPEMGVGVGIHSHSRSFGTQE